VTPGAAIDAEDLSDQVRGTGSPLPPMATTGVTLRRARDLFERQFIVQVLAQHGGNASRTARALGISRVMLHKKLRAYGLRRMDLVRASA
jgi:DNA-binding NtrC family response regulator